MVKKELVRVLREWVKGMGKLREAMVQELYERSEPIDVQKYDVCLKKLAEICLRNKISMPEIRMMQVDEAVADSVNNRIYFCPAYAKYMVAHGSQEQLASMVAHELAHIVLRHDKAVKKTGEYLVDRMAAAFTGDEALHKQALITHEAYVGTFKKVQNEVHQEMQGWSGKLGRLAQKLEQRREERTYGTPDERLDNIQYDITRREIRDQALPLAQAAVADPAGNALQQLAEKFHLDEAHLRETLDVIKSGGIGSDDLARTLASVVSTRVIRQRA